MNSLVSIVLFGEGLATGLTLALMVGPITMVILRYGIQIDRYAGLWAATGTWLSDVIFIMGTFWMTESLTQWTGDLSIRFWIYMTGGIALMFFGIYMMKGRKNNSLANEIKPSGTYTQAFAGGFIVNSLSPFTLFFWIGIAVFLHLQSDNPLWYYAGLMLALAIGDFFKAWYSPKVKIWIREKYVYLVQVIAGTVITLIGLFIIGKGIYEYTV